MITQIHQYVNALPRYHFDNIPVGNQIIANGVYFIFEQGEKFNDCDRIVRIGSHKGANNLINRVNEHFTHPNKDRSIFRKNVGRAILNNRADPYLSVWEIDYTKRIQREEYGHLRDIVYQGEIEEEVSQRIQETMSFSLLYLPGDIDPLEWEKKLITTVSQSRNVLTPSAGWFGRSSPKDEIVQSGLWQSHHLNGQIMTIDEWEDLQVIANQ